MARTQNTVIETEQKTAQRADMMVKKLLLLGAGESGKSTLFKQAISLYGKGYSRDERRLYLPTIHANVIESLQEVARQCDNISPVVTSEASIAKDAISLHNANDFIPDDLAEQIKIFWKDPGVQVTWANRSKYQVLESLNYFLPKLDSLIDRHYEPSQQDLVYTRIRTTGITESNFAINGVSFRLLDVGGQRNERKKWIHCFEGVTAVLFVAALSEYDQTLYEDEHVNRMDEAFNLFDEICNSRFFRETSMILFLNKRDLFEEKIAKVDMKQWFEDYDGGCDYENAVEYIRTSFLRKNRNPRRSIFTHITCATDKDNVKFVFDAVSSIIIKQSLEAVGLLE